jgi:hypothetical protein
MRMILTIGLSCPALLLLTGCNDAVHSAPSPDRSAKSNGTVVVELFQSQGCSSCPPANAALNKLAERSDVIALSYAVTYWDRLGWKDRFADPAFTQRQYDYNKAMQGDGVYTPQVILNGSRAIVGNGQGELAQAVDATRAASGGPSIALEKRSIAIGAGSGTASVWLVRYDPRTQNVAIRAGENEGRTLPHRNIVRQISKLGSWSGKAASYALPDAKASGLRSVILVQRGTAGPIISAKLL